MCFQWHIIENHAVLLGVKNHPVISMIKRIRRICKSHERLLWGSTGAGYQKDEEGQSCSQNQARRSSPAAGLDRACRPPCMKSNRLGREPRDNAYVRGMWAVYAQARGEGRLFHRWTCLCPRPRPLASSLSPHQRLNRGSKGCSRSTELDSHLLLAPSGQTLVLRPHKGQGLLETTR